jgi:hypothetical protein
MPATEPGTINYQVNKAGIVFSFFETDSSVWLSKRGISTFEYDQEFRLKKFYNSLYPLSSSSVYYKNSWAYFFYKKGNLLYITTDSGLVAYNLLNRTSVAFFPSSQASTISFRTVIPLNDNELMIRSFDKGIFIFNTDVKKFTGHFSNSGDCADCLPLRVNYLFKTKRNEIFVTTSSAGKGLMKFNQAAGSFVPVKAVNDEDNRMQVSDLFGMDEDGAGNLWITSSAGLFIYDPAGNLILPQQKENDQPGSLFRICFDNYGNAWANGPSGIWCCIKAKNKWINFNGQDGLPGSDFEGIIARKKNGDIVAGLEGAVAVFHPGTLTEPMNNYPAIITEAAADSKVTPFPLTAVAHKKLVLGADQNSFSVDFTILNYLNPSASRYYYRLSPLMNDFKLNDNGHINFNGLAPGHYTLHVKGGDKAGNIFGKEDVLEIEVEPRWYQLGLFKVFCLIAAAVVIFYFVRRRISAIKKEATFKQKIAETQMKALRAQMNPHFIFNSLNSIENFMMQNEKRLASDYLNKFSKLIRSILDSSRNELVPVAKDMEALQLYVDLEQLRFNNKFIYKTVIDPVLINGDYRIPSLLIQPYVENAIVHGLAHSEATGLSLTVTATLDGDTIKYTVQDNGIGRQKAAAYNMQNKPHHKSVGLAITKDRIVYFNGPKFTGEPVTITDLYGTENEPCGTKVDILIKAL